MVKKEKRHFREEFVDEYSFSKVKEEVKEGKSQDLVFLRGRRR